MVTSFSLCVWLSAPCTTTLKDSLAAIVCASLLTTASGATPNSSNQEAVATCADSKSAGLASSSFKKSSRSVISGSNCTKCSSTQSPCCCLVVRNVHSIPVSVQAVAHLLLLRGFCNPSLLPQLATAGGFFYCAVYPYTPGFSKFFKKFVIGPKYYRSLICGRETVFTRSRVWLSRTSWWGYGGVRV